MTDRPRTLIVGGSSGIGEAAANAFVTSGHEVIIASRSAGKLAAAEARLADVATIEVDATSDASVRHMMGRVGAIDNLVLTAGAGIAVGPFIEIGAEALRATLETKLLAQARVAQHAASYVRACGSITFTGGVAGQKALLGMAAAGVANMGLQALAQTLAVELAPIRVNVVMPGMVQTPAYAGMRSDFFARAASNLPVGRVGQPDDLGQAIHAIAMNGFISGANITADGGAQL